LRFRDPDTASRAAERFGRLLSSHLCSCWLALARAQLQLRKLSTAELIAILKELPRRPLLAGAQDKVAVRIEEDGVSLPLGGAPSAHILKPAIDRFEPDTKSPRKFVKACTPCTNVCHLDSVGALPSFRCSESFSLIAGFHAISRLTVYGPSGR